MIGTALALLLAGAALELAPACSAFTTPESAELKRTRRITAEDLARIADIGNGGANQDSPGISVSPDGKLVAFQVRQANPASNGYCLSMWVAPISGASPAIMVDQGGELIRQTTRFWGGPVYPTGDPDVVKPAWSPDGHTLAFLKRVDGHTQVWLANAHGGGAYAATQERDDVTAFSWESGGGALRVTTHPVRALEAARDVEGRAGYRLDARFVPVSSALPYLMSPLADNVTRISVASGHRAPPQADRPLADPAERQSERQRWFALGSVHALSEGTKADLASLASFGMNCSDAQCHGPFLAAWTDSRKQHVAFLRREGVGNGTMALYLWKIGSRHVRSRYRTTGLLLGCEPSGGALVCAQETATQPRRIIRLDPATGKISVIFDPNPQFRAFDLGSVRRLSWSNDRGLFAYGDLVLPPDHKPGQRHPLIVVTYRSRGFLRGGTGDEYPIFPLAARGYAVLSFDAPPDLASLTTTSSQADYSRMNNKDWANRSSIQSSLAQGLRVVDALGATDPSRRGITGLSDGATTAWFALINSELFQAAAMSTCCMEPEGAMALLGEAGARHFEQSGFPRSASEQADYAPKGSVAFNAARLSVPTLLNLADAEFRHALVSIKALRAYGQPVEAFVFPDEEHVKWQPAHRLAIYERNIAWFDYWLRGIAPLDMVIADRWNGLRSQVRAHAKPMAP
ncbi:Atxe2 family lasso peptide isopeptidase [Sphingobium sp. RAC03]|uniref:Atxe2 family lasso peptide isopeptidase n=1 Tax=Sphingobium sp. RAC03 TaxID=1843368 RepID=UPI000858203F|nr:Atxe2 family lasso peptide isopeptidase [Sphingobium sp. RAC03]AOF97571.1 prolyl oligopeptidase family protein [Sphingobium sp. RAC03]